jgi:DnaJ-domain-containing protein 1
MNPYEVLGVSTNATELEIKRAYQKLVKQYHPDAGTPNASHQQMIAINEAYEILSDPVKRKAYDNHVTELLFGQPEEDPVEAYKREFKRKRWEKEKREKEQKLQREKLVMKYLRFAAMPLLAFAILLVIDSLLPPHVYSEVADEGWQESTGGKHRTLMSYMRTHSFKLTVPHSIHVNYPYFDDKKPPLIIEASPILAIPERIAVTMGNSKYQARVEDTVFYWIPFHYLLLISAAFTVWRKEHSWFTYVASGFPVIIFCLILLRFWQAG